MLQKTGLEYIIQTEVLYGSNHEHNKIIKVHFSLEHATNMQYSYVDTVILNFITW